MPPGQVMHLHLPDLALFVMPLLSTGQYERQVLEREQGGRKRHACIGVILGVGNAGVQAKQVMLHSHTTLTSHPSVSTPAPLTGRSLRSMPRANTRDPGEARGRGCHLAAAFHGGRDGAWRAGQPRHAAWTWPRSMAGRAPRQESAVLGKVEEER